MSFSLAISQQPATKPKTFTYKQLPVFDLRPATDNDGHYLGHYTVGSYIECLGLHTKLKYKPCVPSALWVYPQRQKKNKQISL